MAVARMTIGELSAALAAIVGPDRVSTRAADRTTYSRDMWPRALLAVRAGAAAEHPPDVIVWPETAAEVAAIVAAARRLRVPVVPYGAGSGVCGGAVPIYGGITIDLKRMDRLLRVDADDLTCEAEAGINGERLERELERRGFTLGHFPSSIYCSTLGGWLAARSGGQMSTKYGKIEDMTLGVTCVTGRGDVITTGRSGHAAAGPDWTQLLVGSEGTLGVITSARLRIRPAPEVRRLRGYEFASVLAGLEAIRRVLQRGLRPAVVRLYDEFDTLVALRGKRERPARGEERDDQESRFSLSRELLHAALDRPRLTNALAETFARRVGRRGCLLIAGVEGSQKRADVEANLVFGELARAGGRDLGEEPGKKWYENRYAVSYDMPRIFRAGAFVDTMEVASTWERLPDLYEHVRHAIGQHAFVMAHFSHAYPEGCSIYFTFAAHATTRHAAERKYDAIWKDGLTAATRAGGTISHHHGVGLLKASFMADEHREAMSIYTALKQALDPDGILNPGKMGLPPPRGEGGTPWAQIA